MGADFDIDDLVPLEHVKDSTVPAIFMHARQDNLVSPSHSRQLYEAYAGDKELVTVDGDHNSERSVQVINHAVAFFKRCWRLSELDVAIPRHLEHEQVGVSCQDNWPRHNPPVPRQPI